MPDASSHSDSLTQRQARRLSADAPSVTTYQWQQGNGSSWTNLGTSITSVTKTVSFASRGTRKFRVLAQHSVVPSAESDSGKFSHGASFRTFHAHGEFVKIRTAKFWNGEFLNRSGQFIIRARYEDPSMSRGGLISHMNVAESKLS